ncbi:K(+)/H(+) antiporter [Blyttiomyces sp. JEL0837]|nr:K(+)/H(+) antiporter [Blyttiomyces sp. JEL0837]
MTAETGFISTNQAFQADGLAKLLLQVVIILLVCRAISVPFKLINQPRVIAEVIGGILLGPTALGRWTWFNKTIFPKGSMPPLNLLANFGLVMFLLLMGLELDLSVVLKRARTSLTISLTGISLTFLISIGISRFFYDQIPGMSDIVAYPKLLIFIGVAMSVTALPVLARILTERKLLKTPVGITVLSAAAVDDAVGWTALALVIALIAAASPLTGLYILLCVVGFAAFMFIVVGRILQKIHQYFSSLHNQNANRDSETLSQPMVIVAFLTTLAASFFTSAIGIHAIFGAFLTGLVLPRENGFAHKFTEKIEELVSVVLLPLYFTYSGLRTNIGAVNTGISFLSLVLVLLGCMTGKIVGCSMAARFCGLNWRESFAVGVLMDTKGLVEIIILNIGLDANLINDQVFAIMVLLAIITTCITTPLVTLIYPESYHSPTPEQKVSDKSTDVVSQLQEPTRLLLCLPSTSSVASMMTIIHHLSGSAGRLSPITGGPWVSLHAARFRRLTDRLSALIMAASQVERDPALSSLQMFGRLRGLPVVAHTVLAEAKNYAKEVYKLAVDTQSDVIVVPWKHVHFGGVSKTSDGQLRDSGLLDVGNSAASSLSAIFAATTEVPPSPKITSSNRVSDLALNQGPEEISAAAAQRERESAAAAAAARETLVAEMTTQLLKKTAAQVAVLVDRSDLNVNMPPNTAILVPFFGGPDDRAALLMALRLATLPNAVVTILHIRHLYRVNEETDIPGNDATQMIGSDPQAQIRRKSSIPAVTRLRRRFFPGQDAAEAHVEEDAHPSLPDGHKVDPVDAEDSRLLNLVLNSSGPVVPVPIPTVTAAASSPGLAKEHEATLGLGSGHPNTISAAQVNFPAVNTPVSIAPPPNSIPFRRVATASSMVHDDAPHSAVDEVAAAPPTVTMLAATSTATLGTPTTHTPTATLPLKTADSSTPATTSNQGPSHNRRPSALDLSGSPFVRTATASSQITLSAYPSAHPNSALAGPNSSLPLPTALPPSPTDSQQLPRPAIHLIEVAAVDPLLALCQAMEDPTTHTAFNMIVMGRFGPNWTARLDDQVAHMNVGMGQGQTVGWDNFNANTRRSTILGNFTFPWSTGGGGSSGGPSSFNNPTSPTVTSHAAAAMALSNAPQRGDETANNNTVTSMASYLRSNLGGGSTEMIATNNATVTSMAGIVPGSNVNATVDAPNALEERVLGHAAATLLRGGIGNASLMVVRKIRIEKFKDF